MEEAAEKNEKKYKYKKRTGTGGIQGKLYETKLLSFILFKLIKDEEIKDFYLGTNLDAIDVFDDICFKFKMNNKWVAAFIQTKHRENLKKEGSITDALLIKDKSDYNLLECFKSYLKIKQKFKNTQKENKLFSDFEDTDACRFIIYTPEADNIATDRKKTIMEMRITKEIRDLISTQEVGEHIFQIKYKDSDDNDLKSFKEKNTDLHTYTDLNNITETFKDFINCLFFYTKEAQQHGVEKLLIKELQEYYQADNNNKKYLFNVHPEALMLKLHDEVQKWWLRQGNSYYLTRSNSHDFLEKFRSEVFNTPYLTVLNFNCTKELNKYAIEFKEEKFTKFKLNNLPKKVTIIFTNAMELTGIKFVQCSRTKSMKDVKLSFIDLESITTLTHNESQMLLKEILFAELDILVILYKTPEPSTTEILKEIIEKFQNKIVVVTDQSTDIKLNLDKDIHVDDKDNRVNDKDNNFVDLLEQSQHMIVKSNKITIQGHEGSLTDLIGEQCKHLITAEILLKLLKSESIAIGKPLCDKKYFSMRYDYDYIPRKLKKNEASNEIKDLKDINSSFVVITAEPGMGKSTLLTHLSLETKKTHPSCWIVRINLIEHCSEFKDWEEKKRVYSLKEAMTLICNIELGHIEGTFELQVSMEGVLGLKPSDNDIDRVKGPSLLLLELIIHSFNNRSIIFLFDGFDEIYPHYEETVVKFIKTLISVDGLTEESKGKHINVWITSRPYNSIKKTLEDAFFVASHQLEPLLVADQEIFYEKYFDANIKLAELSAEQFKNIEGFFEFMLQFYREYTEQRIVLRSTNSLLYSMYGAAVDYFHTAIHQATLVDSENIKKEWVSKFEFLSFYDQLHSKTKKYENAMSLAGIPLHMHIAANYFVNEIKNTAKQDAIKKWDLDINSFALYESFLETKLKIRLEEKNRRNTSIPDERMVYEKEKKESTEVHKQLAFFSLLHEFALLMRSAIVAKKSDFWNKKPLWTSVCHWILDNNCLEHPFFHGIFSEKEYFKIKEVISIIDKDEEKTGIILHLHNNIPIFVHLVFAEYFAVEYISDKLKSAENDLKMKILEFIMNHQLMDRMSLFNIYNSHGMMEIFNYKLKHDNELYESLSDDEIKKFIFEVMCVQTDCYCIIRYQRKNGLYRLRFSSLCKAAKNNFTNIAMFLLSCVKDNLNEGNLERCVKILSHNKNNFFYHAARANENKLIVTVLDMLKTMDSALVTKVLRRYENLPKCIRSESRQIYSNEEVLSMLQNELRDFLEERRKIYDDEIDDSERNRLSQIEKSESWISSDGEFCGVRTIDFPWYIILVDFAPFFYFFAVVLFWCVISFFITRCIINIIINSI